MTIFALRFKLTDVIAGKVSRGTFHLSSGFRYYLAALGVGEVVREDRRVYMRVKGRST